ncbi:N-formimino-L-glutamate deiminase [Paramesorhizobium deserti]|uniref:N-formimino-L-glutamate deiminase n=1 Tax=Paramesorhizobium deserti TaxID=1494590 RepID=A0A135HTX0_9HYPH|nr:formimidoylglutamate deiminase [Paramesorhizobium deserti]KXF76637.1 N-formimino-L-glutamate deiminase [Paramesorhizobium deserti]
MVNAGGREVAIHAECALLPGGWAHDVRISFTDGLIASVETDVEARPGDERHAAVLPGMPNLHSHAFQYGMAGLAERRGPSADSFWSWRDVMYRFALSMTPEQVEAVALQLYVEMLEAGFTRVGEFHYLHHDRDGSPYGDIAEMAARIVSAAGQSGIGLTLLPVFYAHSTFGGAAPNEGQRRFINDLDSFARLIDGCAPLLAGLDGAVLGVAPHSLRAVTPGELAEVTGLLPQAPVHIHIAEQVKEVEDCIAWSGLPPVEWLLDNMDVDGRWCLIHATHMKDEETRRMAASGAIAGLCPVTEANLGDGTFQAPLFTAHGGRFGIGSDSNVLISIGDELRQLEYSQRLFHRARNVMAVAEGSTGRALFDGAFAGGSAALGVSGEGIAVGQAADLVSLDTERLAGARDDAILDGWIFAARAHVDSVWVRGVKQVEGGRHHLHNHSAHAFDAVLRELLQR